MSSWRYRVRFGVLAAGFFYYGLAARTGRRSRPVALRVGARVALEGSFRRSAAGFAGGVHRFAGRLLFVRGAGRRRPRSSLVTLRVSPVALGLHEGVL